MSKIKKFAAFTTVAGMITVGAFLNHSASEYGKNVKAVQKLEDTVLGQCFETEWLSSNVDEKQLNGLTKAQVVDLVRSSKTTIELEMYRTWKNTVAYTYSTTKRIWMNRKFHDGYTQCEKVGNIGHELFHKIGFTHDVKATARRPLSANYVAGRIIKKCCEE